MTQVAIQLPDELSQFVNQTVQAGDYHNADDFFINILSLYKEQVEAGLSEADQAKIADLRRDIQTAAEQLDRGKGIEIDWEAKLAKRHQAFASRRSL